MFSLPNTPSPNTQSPRWTHACTRCDWIGTLPTHVMVVGVGCIADCPVCGHSCTSDDPEFEPRAGCLDGTAPGFDPLWTPSSSDMTDQQEKQV